MNRSLWQLIGLGGLMLVLALFDITVIQPIGWLGSGLGLTVFSVAVITARLGAWPGVIAGSVAGLTWQTFSGLPSAVHPIAFLLSVGMIVVLSRRVLATRSLLSFVGLVAVGTVSYQLSVWGITTFAHVIQPTALEPRWPVWWTIAGVHAITHPLLAGFLWRLSGRTRDYATAGLTVDQSF